jgi:hypothetical protein
VSGVTGTKAKGPMQDNGDGTYTVTATWDEGFGVPPALALEQPGRPPVVVQEPSGGDAGRDAY